MFSEALTKFVVLSVRVAQIRRCCKSTVERCFIWLQWQQTFSEKTAMKKLNYLLPIHDRGMSQIIIKCNILKCVISETSGVTLMT